MPEFCSGLQLCKGFFNDAAKPILDRFFPELRYSAGLLGYGSDVLGYDDEVSRDHMWGPRFYLFLEERDLDKKPAIFRAFAENLPYEYRGYSVNFSRPNPEDHGVRAPEPITEGFVDPLIFIETFDQFLVPVLGGAKPESLQPLDWLTFSEHRLLSLASGALFSDGLNLQKRLAPLRFYPEEVKLYLLASNWEILSEEQAFVKRCGQRGDDIGSRLICGRIAERLMRLCFFYREQYTPYSKWFGTAFRRLDVDGRIKEEIAEALKADDVLSREEHLVAAQALVAELHNESGLTAPVEFRIEPYFGRDIKVIYADKFSRALGERLQGTALENVPYLGTLSQIGGLIYYDNYTNYEKIKGLYR